MFCARHLSTAVIAVLGMTGCDVFDESLIPRNDASTLLSEASSPSIPEEANPSATIDVSGDCDSAPLLTALPNIPLSLRITDGSCGGNPPAAVSCIDGALGGKNFYFAFKSEVDPSDADPQKWHVNGRNSSNNPGNFAFYVMSSCATNSCSDVNAGIRSTSYEELSFRVIPGQKYVVAVNTTTSAPCDTGQLPKVQLQHDRCMDGIVEHGEACDPPTPNCVACRYSVVSPNAQGIEPNDSPLDANIIPIGPTRFLLSGGAVEQNQAAANASTVLGVDPYDFYRLQVANGADPPKTVRVTLSWHEPGSEGGACADAYLAAIWVTDKWYQSSSLGHSGIQPGPPTSMPDDDGSGLFVCTSFIDIPFDPDLPSGMPTLSRYIIRVAAAPSKQVIYDLTLEQPSDQ